MSNRRPGIWSFLTLAVLASGCTGVSGRVAVKGDALLDPDAVTASVKPASPRQTRQREEPKGTEPMVRPAAAVALAPRLGPLTPTAPRPSSLEPAAPAAPSAASIGDSRYDHDQEYSRLRGRIDRPYSGGVKLRFCDHAKEDRLGGCVFLTSNAGVKDLPEGAWVEVRGRLLAPANDPNRETIYSYPSFEVQSLTVLRP